MDERAFSGSRESLTLRPIGVVHSPYRERLQAPRQPRAGRGETGKLELFAESWMTHALEDLSSFRFIWVVFWFHQSSGFRSKVQPPRSDRKRGVFATRSPYRPNPIGLSAVELLGIDGRILSVAQLDMLDQTPILDLKPYIPYTDCITDASSGWLDPATTAPADPISPYEVEFSSRALEQLEFLRTRGVELRVPVTDVLALGPEPHSYRRIKKRGSGGCTLSYKSWRLDFMVVGRRIAVSTIRTGYRGLALEPVDEPEIALHLAFVAAFG